MLNFFRSLNIKAQCFVVVFASLVFSAEATTLSTAALGANSSSSASPDPLASLFNQQPTFLPVEEAFVFSSKQSGNTLSIDFTIADDYYMYADKFQFKSDGAEIVDVTIPPATQIEDEFFGVVDVFFFQAQPSVTLNNIKPGATVTMRYQGCAKAGFCYNPVTLVIDLEASDGAGAGSAIKKNAVKSASSLSGSNTTAADSTSLQDSLASRLQNESFLWTLLIFFGLGVGLAFTPCVFPMFPILSSIIAGQKNLTLKKGLWLSFIYVQGMALTYSLLGLVVASMGVQFQAALQAPVVLYSVSIIFIALAGSMFGWYNLQLPDSWTSKLTKVSNDQKSGNVAGVFIMGLLSGLIASPCTTAPLTGALLYVAQTGDLVIGFITLYVLSLGMGLPLLLIGASGGSVMPKAGNWMNVVKTLFGFVLLAVPLILLERIVDLEWIMGFGGVLLLLLASYLHSQQLSSQSNSAKSGFWLTSIVALFVGLLLTAKAVLPEHYLASSNSTAAQHEEQQFRQVSNLAELKVELTKARENGQPVMFDLYADWCFACKEFELFTFSDPAVAARMSDFVLLQIDATENNANDVALLKEFDILGLPTILYFDKGGNELTSQRVTGFMNAESFLAHLNNLSL
jgi:thioredoxin:protein disulfide reductase